MSPDTTGGRVNVNTAMSNRAAADAAAHDGGRATAPETMPHLDHHHASAQRAGSPRGGDCARHRSSVPSAARADPRRRCLTGRLRCHAAGDRRLPRRPRSGGSAHHASLARGQGRALRDGISATGDLIVSGRRPRVRPGRATRAAAADARRPGRRRSSAPASCGEPHRVAVLWHSVGNRMLTTLSNMLHQPEPDRHGDLLQGRSAARCCRRCACARDRFGFEPEVTAKVAQARRAHLRGADQLLRPHLRRRARRSAGRTGSRRCGTSCASTA